MDSLVPQLPRLSAPGIISAGPPRLQAVVLRGPPAGARAPLGWGPCCSGDWVLLEDKHLSSSRTVPENNCKSLGALQFSCLARDYRAMTSFGWAK